MSEETPQEVAGPQPEVVAEVVAAPPVPEEKTYTYQPKDENGNVLGAPQVIKYHTSDELAEKLADQNTNLIRLNRKLNRDLRLGNVMQDTIPDTVRRFDPSKYDLNPVPLSAEERLQVVQDVNDPENFDRGIARAIKAEIGDPEALRATIRHLREQADRVTAKEEAEAFVRSNHEYYVCPENFATLCNWMVKNDLEPVKENFDFAFDKLKDVLVQRPPKTNIYGRAVVEPTAPAPAPAVPVAENPPVNPQPASPAAAPEPRRATPPALTRSNSSDAAPVKTPGSSITYTDTQNRTFTGREAIERMPSDVYRQRLKDPAFRAAEDELDKQAARR
jgi:hypothetical protein